MQRAGGPYEQNSRLPLNLKEFEADQSNGKAQGTRKGQEGLMNELGLPLNEKRQELISAAAGPWQT